jgi:hypothetical protein
MVCWWITSLHVTEIGDAARSIYGKYSSDFPTINPFLATIRAGRERTAGFEA